MAKIKLCGIQCQEDIDIIQEQPIDYAGFVFAKSKRQISPQLASTLIAQLHFPSVGVFVNEEPHRIASIAKETGLSIIQLHGDEDVSYIKTLRTLTTLPIWKALRLQNIQESDQLKAYHVDQLLLDAYHPTQYGGSGKRIDMDILRQLDVSNLFLAGGVSSETIDEMLALHPLGLDVSSSIETGGRKDKAKIDELMKHIRRNT